MKEPWLVLRYTLKCPSGDLPATVADEAPKKKQTRHVWYKMAEI
jgi:hypothetical protein